MFSDRIERRKQLWWQRSGSWRGLGDRLRRLRMILATVPAEAPPSRWKRGEHWQRRLLNKYHAKGFVTRMNCRVPETYWHGRLLTRSLLASLPDQFVLKPVLGTAHKGVHVVSGSRELISGRQLTREQLFDEVIRKRGRLSHVPMMAEEFIANEKERQTLPLDYKFYMFADRIGAIEVVNRTVGREVENTHRFYTARWQPIDDPIQTYFELDAVRAPPACLPRMIEVARKLGAEIGTFMRVDLYARGEDCVFGEFSSVPYNGRTFTAYADQLFETLWRETAPDEI